MSDFLFAEGKDEGLTSKIEKELFESRIINLNENVTQFTLDYIIPLIQKINLDDEKNNIPVDQRKPIELNISSYGGGVYEGWGIVSHIINSKTPVHTYLHSFAMSMGLAIFLAGSKRYISDYATLMYHELSSTLEGTREEIKRAADEYDRLQEIYDNFVVKRTNLTLDVLKSHQEKVSDWYIDADTAIQYKLATDKI